MQKTYIRDLAIKYSGEKYYTHFYLSVPWFLSLSVMGVYNVNVSTIFYWGNRRR